MPEATPQPHDRVRAAFALALGAVIVLVGAAGRLVHTTPWPAELVVTAAALTVVALLALVVVRPRRRQLVSLGATPLAAVLGVVMAVWALVVPELGPALWPAAVTAAAGATTLAAFARWSLAAGAHLVSRAGLDPSHRYAVARSPERKTKMSPASAIRAGDHVEVPGGQRVPTDGVVVEGEGFADERALTAADLSVAKAAGDAVLAATTTDVPNLVYAASHAQAESLAVRLHEHQRALLRAVAHDGDGAGGRWLAWTVASASIIAAVAYVLVASSPSTPGVMLLPAVAGIMLALNASAPLVASRLGLAHAISRATQRGIIPREPRALVALGRIARWQADARALAPTGRLEVAGEADELLPIAAALLLDADGPDARVIVAEAKRRGLRAPIAAAVRRSNGAWHGTVQGSRWCLGPRGAVTDEARVDVPHELEASVGFLEERSASTWVLARTDDAVAGAIGVVLEVEPDLARVAQALRATVMPGPPDGVRGAIADAARIDRDGPPLRARDATLLAPGSPRPSAGLQVEVREPHPSVRLEAPVTCFAASAVHLPAVIDEVRALRRLARGAALMGLGVPLLLAAILLALGVLDPVLGTLAGTIGAVLATRVALGPG